MNRLLEAARLLRDFLPENRCCGGKLPPLDACERDGSIYITIGRESHCYPSEQDAIVGLLDWVNHWRRDPDEAAEVLQRGGFL